MSQEQLSECSRIFWPGNALQALLVISARKAGMQCEREVSTKPNRSDDPPLPSLLGLQPKRIDAEGGRGELERACPLDVPEVVARSHFATTHKLSWFPGILVK